MKAVIVTQIPFNHEGIEWIINRSDFPPSVPSLCFLVEDDYSFRLEGVKPIVEKMKMADCSICNVYIANNKQWLFFQLKFDFFTDGSVFYKTYGVYISQLS